MAVYATDTSHVGWHVIYIRAQLGGYNSVTATVIEVPLPIIDCSGGWLTAAHIPDIYYTIGYDLRTSTFDEFKAQANMDLTGPPGTSHIHTGTMASSFKEDAGKSATATHR